MPTPRPGRYRPSGFTLIEAAVVIAITGILASIIVVFITKPVQGYVDAVSRAELTDAADVALRRITRDVRLALPNSLRVTTSGGVNYVEFILTSSGGRYRDTLDGYTPPPTPDCDSTPTPANGPCFLDFTTPTNVSFDVLGTMPTMAVNDYIVVYNLGPGNVPADAYNFDGMTCLSGGCNIAKISALPSPNLVTLTNNPFQRSSPNRSFQVVQGGVKAVTYACPTAIAGNLTRFWNYGFNASQPTSFTGGSSALLGTNATCEVGTYTNAGLLNIKLTLTNPTNLESVTLFQQIHVDNAP